MVIKAVFWPPSCSSSKQTNTKIPSRIIADSFLYQQKETQDQIQYLSPSSVAFLKQMKLLCVLEEGPRLWQVLAWHGRISRTCLALLWPEPCCHPSARPFVAHCFHVCAILWEDLMSPQLLLLGATGPGEAPPSFTGHDWGGSELWYETVWKCK